AGALLGQLHVQAGSGRVLRLEPRLERRLVGERHDREVDRQGHADILPVPDPVSGASAAATGVGMAASRGRTTGGPTWATGYRARRRCGSCGTARAWATSPTRR